MSSYNLGSLMRRNAQLGQLFAQAKVLQRLQTRLESRLPPQLAQHCQVAALEQGVLTLHTDSPAWAAKLRFLTADLLHIFENDSATGGIKTIRVKARPPETSPHTNQQAPRMSPQTARFLRDVADTLDNSELRAALIRLSEN